ncbi:hypothetical protein LOCC1_G005605 [Lachnellula occidentalis]|uniref:DUF7726 domain-containing protein n=1 Tax=Lachnellula occidentalis TaxID=215460 RepID=A0A8H8S201_9HELO|nr:hypothetical protein LOCC1_G005605 [Lachnellula occidentalis]
MEEEYGITGQGASDISAVLLQSRQRAREESARASFNSLESMLLHLAHPNQHNIIRRPVLYIMSYEYVLASEQYRRPLGPANSNGLLNAVPLATSGHKPTVAPAPAPLTAKRKAFEFDSDEGDGYDIFSQNCDQVRRKIRTFLSAGEMKIGELHKTLGVSAKSLQTFLGMNGPDNGMNTATYPAAYRFFKQREAEGIKVPKKKVKKEEEAKKNDVSGIQLDGEADMAVPVYDSCDEIRKKISAYLREPQVTQAAFLREIAKTYLDGRKLQSKVLNDFLSKKGASAGNTSAVFYSSYVFFEKMRLRDSKPKSKHRKEMETRHSDGFQTDRRRDRVWCMDGEHPYQDAYGGLHFTGRR